MVNEHCTTGLPSQAIAQLTIRGAMMALFIILSISTLNKLAKNVNNLFGFYFAID